MREVAEALYWELNKIFSSIHNDNAKEQEEAIELLRRTLELGIEADLIISKMNQMVSRADRQMEYKVKLSNAIRNRFWEKSFVVMIPHRPFKIDG